MQITVMLSCSPISNFLTVSGLELCTSSLFNVQEDDYLVLKSTAHVVSYKHEVFCANIQVI